MSVEDKREHFLAQRSDKFTIVLNDNELKLFKSADDIVLQFNTSETITPIYIACIKHDRDKTDDGTKFKTIHYHVVVQFNKIARIGTILNYICDMFKCNPNQVSIDKCNSICMQSRYLIHADDFDKARYYESEVSVPKSCEAVFNRYLSLVIVRDYHDLINVVKTYHYNLEECMENIAHWDKWRRPVLDLINNYYRKGKY